MLPIYPMKHTIVDIGTALHCLRFSRTPGCKKSSYLTPLSIWNRAILPTPQLSLSYLWFVTIFSCYTNYFFTAFTLQFKTWSLQLCYPAYLLWLSMCLLPWIRNRNGSNNQQLRILAALSEDAGVIPWHPHCSSQSSVTPVWADLMLSSGLQKHCMPMVRGRTCRQNMN